MAESPESRLAHHKEIADSITSTLLQLVDLIRSAAMRVHNEIEGIHERQESLELLHHDPASHGRALSDGTHFRRAKMPLRLVNLTLVSGGLLALCPSSVESVEPGEAKKGKEESETTKIVTTCGNVHEVSGKFEAIKSQLLA